MTLTNIRPLRPTARLEADVLKQVRAHQIDAGMVFSHPPAIKHFLSPDYQWLIMVTPIPVFVKNGNGTLGFRQSSLFVMVYDDVIFVQDLSPSDYKYLNDL